MIDIAKLKAAPQELQVAFAPATQAELKALGTKPDGYIAGWASSTALNHYGYSVAADAFDEAIASRGFTGPKGIRFLLQHDWSRIGGVIEVLERRGNRIWIEVQLLLDIGYVKDFHVAAKAVGGLNFSVGFRVIDTHYDDKTDDLTVTKGDLYEISGVTFGAQDDAEMTVVHSRPAPDACQTIAEFEKRLVSLGLATSRNDARRLAQEAKRHVHLFQKPPATPVVPAVEPPPVSADMTDLATQLAAMRAMLTCS
jgi:HK97 family phage prohead protease